MMSVPPSLYHHHPKQEREEVEAIVSRHSLQFRSQGGDVGGCFHGGSPSAAGNWPDGTFGGGIADNGSIRPAHTRRRKPRDLEIRVCGDLTSQAVNLAGDRASPFIRDHGGGLISFSPAVTASARANFPPRFARARQLFRRKPGVSGVIDTRDIADSDRGAVRGRSIGLRVPNRSLTNFQPADEPFEILVKPVPRFAHTHSPIRRRLPAPAKMSGWATTGSFRSSLSRQPTWRRSQTECAQIHHEFTISRSAERSP